MGKPPDNLGIGKARLTATAGWVMILSRHAAAAGLACAKGQADLPQNLMSRWGWTMACSPDRPNGYPNTWACRPIHERGEWEMDDGAAWARHPPLSTASSQVTRQGPL